MKKLFSTLLLSLSLVACATNSNPNTIDSDNAFKSNQIDSPNVGSRAYSGADFPSENQLETKPAN